MGINILGSGRMIRGWDSGMLSERMGTDIREIG